MTAQEPNPLSERERQQVVRELWSRNERQRATIQRLRTERDELRARNAKLEGQ